MAVDIQSRALSLLRQTLGNPNAEFRDGQWEAIEQIVQQQARVLVVQRTGWGKSLVYFLATRLLRDQGKGPTLLISPLLALMRNQVVAAERIGIRAKTIHSENTEEWSQIGHQLHADQVDVLFVSPERLSNADFRTGILGPVAGRVGLFVVDEAHCISDWGHDFRPDYLRITRILQALPQNIPVLATTATANNRVIEDVKDQIGPHLQVSRGPLLRESLRLQNIDLPGQASRMAWLAEQVPLIPGNGIIYALTIRDAQRVAGWLQSQGINAQAYWGGQDADERVRLEQQLLNNEVKALVATTALSVGFDKPDLGFVIHFQRPGSVVHYYQQVGRAGRAITEAYGILLSGREDQNIVDYFLRTAFPPEGHISDVLATLKYATHGLSLTAIEKQVNLTSGQIRKVLTSLAAKSPAPVTKNSSLWYATSAQYTPDLEKIERLKQVRIDEQARMQDYTRSRVCLMLFLAQELDDSSAVTCGKCAVCLGNPLLPETCSASLVAEANLFLRRIDQIISFRKEWPAKRRIRPEQQSQEGRALCLWGDDGWGELVRRGKQEDGRFSDALVQAVVEMVRQRWQPLPSPTWITCVPSINNPTLVSEFARRVAQQLRLPFVACISKTRSTRPQKEMQNTQQQFQNLDGAFSVEHGDVRPGPVLLIDDMVDSRWTFTVISSLLRQAGSGVVFPLALAMTTKNESE